MNQRVRRWAPAPRVKQSQRACRHCRRGSDARPTPATARQWPKSTIALRPPTQEERMDLQVRNNVHLSGDQSITMMFAHGFGCDQNMWRLLTPSFEGRMRTMLFDHVGSGKSDLSSYDRTRYASLHGYASDVNDLLDAYAPRNVVFVGHSVSAMIGMLADL